MRLSRSSVRLRLAAGAVAGLLVVLVISWFGLVALFERHVERRVGSELDLHLARLAAATRVLPDGRVTLDDEPADPRFSRVRGGLYWQVTDETTGALARSRSLWDARLRLPAFMPAVGALDVHDIAGPAGATLRVHARRLMLDDGSRERPLRFAVAIDRRDIDAMTDDFARDLVLALSVLGAVLAVASLVQISMGVAPLRGIGRAVAGVRSGATARLPAAAADEVQPLVQEVNALLDQAEMQVARARERAADLAHALKTPLAALKADASRLSLRGEQELAAGIDAAVDAMSAQVERELARARVRHATRGVETGVRAVALKVTGVLARTPAADNVTFAIDLPDTLRVAIDETDLAEVMGNLLENAVRHAQASVRVHAASVPPDRVRLLISDDGSGLDAEQRAAVLRRGVRLDSKGDGAGLGLAIVADILEAHGTALELRAAPEGGVEASFVLRGAGVDPAPGLAPRAS
jgi:signal transduction histidine kinase